MSASPSIRALSLLLCALSPLSTTMAQSVPAHSLAPSESRDTAGKVIVTPEVLLEHMRLREPEPAALSELVWIENGRGVLLNIATDSAPTDSNAIPDYESRSENYSIASLDVASGQVTLLGPGYQPTGASHGDTVAYFNYGSNGRQVTLARSNGERLCSIRDRDLMPNASSIQALALTADGNRLALAVGFNDLPATRESPPEDEPAVRVMDTRLETPTHHGVTLWVMDVRCRQPRRIADTARFKIGRLAWIERDNSVIAVAETPVRGQGFPRTDLLLFDVGSNAWRTFVRNVGGMASSRRTGFLDIAPSGKSVAFTYDEEGLPYLLRRQVAVASIPDGNIRVVSTDPREAEGWLDAHTLWITQSAAHPQLSRAAVLSLDGVEREMGDISGHGTPSPDGSKLAWVDTDLYGNSLLRIANLRRQAGQWQSTEQRVVWQQESKLARYARGERRFIRCESGDGVRAAAILMLPLDASPGRRHPLIVDIHSGPRGGLAHPMYSYAPPSVLNATPLEHDMWAAKGYAVLVPDYRASGLYGFKRLPRDGSAFERDFDDIMCNVQAVIDQGIVDPSRMAVVGHSYGGTQVNWIISHSDRFKAAISKEGGFNVSLAVSWGSRGQSNQQLSFMYGVPYDYPERYRRMSIMDSVGNVTTPTLFIEHHGGKRADHLSPWMFAAWQKQGVRAQLRLYDEERHTLSRPSDWKDVLYASITWIDEHVGRASAPLASDVNGEIQARESSGSLSDTMDSCRSTHSGRDASAVLRQESRCGPDPHR